MGNYSSDADTAKGAPVARCTFDPNSALGLTAKQILAAACGDLSAQRVIRNQHGAAVEAIDPSTPHALLYGLELIPYARLCAAHGSNDDARHLAGALCYTFEASRFAGFGNAAESLVGEAVSILERLADDGDEAASIAAVQIVTLHPPSGDIAIRLMKGGN